MATSFTKTYTVQAIYTRNDEGTLSATDLAYIKAQALVAKLLAQDVVMSIGEVDVHIVGSVSVT